MKPGFPRAVAFPTKPVKSLDGATTVVAGKAVALSKNPTLQVIGMVTNDLLVVEVANDFKNPTWVQIGADITKDGAYTLDTGALLGRARITDVSGGGTITAIFGGDED